MPNPTPAVEVNTVTIATGGYLSSELNVYGNTLCGVWIPSTFDGTTLYINASATSGGTKQPIYKNGIRLTYTVAAGSFCAINPADVAGLQFIQFEAATMQATTDTVLTAAYRMV